MSASLVGSEMCIRDSPRTAQKAPPARASEVLFGGVRWGGSPPERECRSCLLYTSDAADDM
eukprot:13293646-Alexandrium_andersonii.AAC.1